MTRYRRFGPPSLTGEASKPATLASLMRGKLLGEAKRRRALALIDGTAKLPDPIQFEQQP